MLLSVYFPLVFRGKKPDARRLLLRSGCFAFLIVRRVAVAGSITLRLPRDLSKLRIATEVNDMRCYPVLYRFRMCATVHLYNGTNGNYRTGQALVSGSSSGSLAGGRWIFVLAEESLHSKELPGL